jgi:hypothetical protein
MWHNTRTCVRERETCEACARPRGDACLASGSLPGPLLTFMLLLRTDSARCLMTASLSDSYCEFSSAQIDAYIRIIRFVLVRDSQHVCMPFRCTTRK